jgi:hypothetical protein
MAVTLRHEWPKTSQRIIFAGQAEINVSYGVVQ